MFAVRYTACLSFVFYTTRLENDTQQLWYYDLFEESSEWLVIVTTVFDVLGVLYIYISTE